jgi:hypothetical protein
MADTNGKHRDGRGGQGSARDGQRQDVKIGQCEDGWRKDVGILAGVSVRRREKREARRSSPTGMCFQGYNGLGNR